VHQHPSLDVPTDRTRKGHALDMAADARELARRMRMVDSGNLLLDDRPIIEVRARNLPLHR